MAEHLKITRLSRLTAGGTVRPTSGIMGPDLGSGAGRLRTDLGVYETSRFWIRPALHGGSEKALNEEIYATRKSECGLPALFRRFYWRSRHMNC
jgi:hypothetical protein